MSDDSAHDSASDIVAAVVRRLVLLVVPVWLLPVIVAASDPESPWPSGAVWAAAAATAVGLLCYRFRSHPAFILVPLVGGVLLLALAHPVVGTEFSRDLIVEQWLNLAAWCIGVLIVSARFGSVGVVAAVAMVAVVIVVRALVVGIHIDADSLAALIAYGLTDGMAAVAAIGALRRTARRTDAFTAERTRAALDLASQRARTLEARRLARAMHDTVVNTLGAIRRWELADPSAVRSRAAADVELLQTLQRAQVRDLDALIDSLQQRAGLLGLVLHVRRDRGVPQPATAALAAIEGACWELLNNVARHAGVAEAHLHVGATAGAVVFTVSDNGRGFDPDSTPLRGLADSVRRRCNEAGIAFALTSGVGAGTSVSLTWSPGAAPGGLDTDAEQSLDQSLALAVGLLALPLTALGVAATARLGFGSETAWFGLLAVVATGWLTLVAFRAYRGAAVVRPNAVVYAALAALALAAPSWGVQGCMRVSEWWWGPFAGLTVGAYAAILDARRRALIGSIVGTWVGFAIAIATLEGATAKCERDTVVFAVLHTGIVLALAASRRNHARIWERGRIAAEEAWRDRLTAASELAAAMLRDRTADFAQAIAQPLMVGLADGTLDPADPEVRTRAGAAEAALRTLGAVPNGCSEETFEAFVAAVEAAYGRGIALHLHMATDREPVASQRPQLAGRLLAFVAACPENANAQVTVLGTGTHITMIGFVRAPVATDAASLLQTAGWDVLQHGDEFVVECLFDVGE